MNIRCYFFLLLCLIVPVAIAMESKDIDRKNRERSLINKTEAASHQEYQRLLSNSISDTSDKECMQEMKKLAKSYKPAQLFIAQVLIGSGYEKNSFNYLQQEQSGAADYLAGMLQINGGAGFAINKTHGDLLMNHAAQKGNLLAQKRCAAIAYKNGKYRKAYDFWMEAGKQGCFDSSAQAAWMLWDRVKLQDEQAELPSQEAAKKILRDGYKHNDSRSILYLGSIALEQNKPKKAFYYYKSVLSSPLACSPLKKFAQEGVKTLADSYNSPEAQNLIITMVIGKNVTQEYIQKYFVAEFLEYLKMPTYIRDQARLSRIASKLAESHGCSEQAVILRSIAQNLEPQKLLLGKEEQDE